MTKISRDALELTFLNRKHACEKNVESEKSYIYLKTLTIVFSISFFNKKIIF